MNSVAEYTYEDTNRHLSESEALEAYKKAKAIYGNDVVHLDDLDCGHWTVKVYSTDSEKQAFYRDRLKKLYRYVLAPFLK